MARPTPAAVYEGADLQAAYERGFEQMYDHESFVLIDRLHVMIDSLRDHDLDRPEAALRAAALEGAADALRALAARMWEGSPWQ